MAHQYGSLIQSVSRREQVDLGARPPLIEQPQPKYTDREWELIREWARQSFSMPESPAAEKSLDVDLARADAYNTSSLVRDDPKSTQQ